MERFFSLLRSNKHFFSIESFVTNRWYPFQQRSIFSTMSSEKKTRNLFRQSFSDNWISLRLRLGWTVKKEVLLRHKPFQWLRFMFWKIFLFYATTEKRHKETKMFSCHLINLACFLQGLILFKGFFVLYSSCGCCREIDIKEKEA